MSKEKEGKAKSGKKAPQKSLKEKRAAKAAKRAEKKKRDQVGSIVGGVPISVNEPGKHPCNCPNHELKNIWIIKS